jgi:hypothetical protein
MPFYAQINEGNICIGISQLSGEVGAGNMIAIEGYDVSLLGKKWTGEGWEEVPQEEQPLPEPTEQDIINAELLLGQAQLIESNAAIEETAAMILLETIQGGM